MQCVITGWPRTLRRVTDAFVDGHLLGQLARLDLLELILRQQSTVNDAPGFVQPTLDVGRIGYFYCLQTAKEYGKT